MRTKATSVSPVVRRAELELFFAGIYSRLEQPKTNVAQRSAILPLHQREFKEFFTAIDHRVEQAEAKQRRLDKRLATGFNVFDLIEPDENKLSDVVADLLDPQGSHGQGSLFLRLLLKQIGLHAEAERVNKATVKREAPTYRILKYRRRMDVFVDGGFLLAIENKVDSLEQTDQVKDYLEHLRHCTRSGSIKSALIYLTPNGRLPKSLPRLVVMDHQARGELHCWSYQEQLLQWLEACRFHCEANRICNFLADFTAYIKSTLKRDSEIIQEEEVNEE